MNEISWILLDIETNGITAPIYDSSTVCQNGGAHTALGDVETVADLLDQVLQPLAEQRGLQTWENLVEYSEARWYPTQIAFGKHKGRDFREARQDEDLQGTSGT